MSPFWPAVFTRLLAGEDLSADEAADAMSLIMRGEASPAQVASFGVALRAKGETSVELGAMARIVLEAAPVVEVPGHAFASSGAGAGGAPTINVSTLAALVAAGAGAVMANQGGRAVDARCGPAELLEGLGVNVRLDAAGVSRCLAECRIGFMFGPVFHPSLANAAVPRREIGVATVFDFLGPLTNPARPAGQVVGVADRRMQPEVADVLAERRVRAYVVRGEDGVAEITTTGPTSLCEVGAGAVIQRHLLPIEMGVPTARLDDLLGGDVASSVAVARAVLGGNPGPHRDIVALNAGAVLMVARMVETLPEGLERAYESIDSGRAGGVLEKWIEVSNRA